MFRGEEAEGHAGADALVGRACEQLAHCERLSHLVLSVPDDEQLSAHELLATVGAAARGRLQSLTLENAQLPPTREGAASAVATLGACYPRRHPDGGVAAATFVGDFFD